MGCSNSTQQSVPERTDPAAATNSTTTEEEFHDHYHVHDQACQYEDQECSICLNLLACADAHTASVVTLNKCKHLYHKACIDTWLRSHTSCPICRATLILNQERRRPDQGLFQHENHRPNYVVFQYGNRRPDHGVSISRRLFIARFGETICVFCERRLVDAYEVVVMRRCGHAFHKACADRSFILERRCPVC